MHGDDADDTTTRAATSGLFPVTRWTRIRQAGLSDLALSAAAMNEICRIYWYPTFVTARTKHRLDHHHAEDVTQSFWSWAVEKDVLVRAEPERGKFRSYLLTCFQRFVGHEWRSQSAQKRGGHVRHVSIQSEEWNERYEREMGAFQSPEQHLASVWENAALEAAISEVEARWAALGKHDVFTTFKAHLTHGAERGGLREIARQHGLTEANARKMVSRLRVELREAGRQWLGSAADDEL